MKSLSFSWPLLSFMFFAFNFFLSQINAKCYLDDENALLAFKSQIIDGNDRISEWKPDIDCCKWSGISCNAVNGRVSDINLRNYNLSGILHFKIGALTSLERLNVEGNKLSGHVPDIFASLPHLIQLNLASNRFSGKIPNSITKLTGLQHLILTNNRFKGTIPDGIRNLTNLYTIELGQNRLSGAIPDIFSSFPQLDIINLSYNNLNGEIPASISSIFTHLSQLDLGHNSLSGNIPSFLGNFNGFRLDLSWNQFTGVIPESFSKLGASDEIILSHNLLVDPVPSIGLLYTTILDLSYNSFQMGKIPDWITASDTLRDINLAGCGIKMKIEDWRPVFLFDSSVIDLSDNEISGNPVKLLNGASNLIIFKASGNQLKFDLGSLKIAKTVKELDLSRNLIYGEVPKSLAGIEKLNVSHNDNLCGFPQPPCKI